MKHRCPNAVFIEIAKLNNYLFRYDGYSKKRKGAVANIVPSMTALVNNV